MLGLALEGGGAKGAFHMGAYKAFIEEGYEFKGITGTSIGALNAAIIVQGDFESGYRFWENMDNSLFFDMEEMHLKKILCRNVDKETIVYLSSKVKNVLENRGIDISKMKELLAKMINEDKLRNSEMDFGMVTVSVSDLKPMELCKEDIPEGKILDYILASANFPLLKNEPLDGKYFLDGAFYDNCPINLLIRKGYKNIIAVRTLGMGLNRKIEDESVNVINIYPSESLGRTLNFNNGRILTNLNMGYCDTMRVLKQLCGIKYYILPEDNLKFFEKLAAMPEAPIVRMGEILNLPVMDSKRLLFERIIPTVSSSLAMPEKSTYQQIITALMELLAEERNIERYKVRSFHEFVNEIAMIDFQGPSFQLRKAKLFPLMINEIDMKRIGEEFLKAYLRE